jgi:membrane-associated protease RseP (regulator of RpoE activity)
MLLGLTIVTTTFAGAGHWASFALEPAELSHLSLTPALFLHGLWFSATVLTILGCHELGHYFACRYYNVDASLPFFIPVPILLTGTMGAFIRIREPIPQKRMLFDIGIAGPIAGFVMAVPLLFAGVWMSRIAPDFNPADLPPGLISYSLGEPLLYKAASTLVWGTVPTGQSLNMHPIAFGAWFGLLATALNLFPIGQLDGGHIAYAVLGRRSTYVTFASIACVMGLTLVASSWIVWTALTVVMLVVFGPHHPRVFDEQVPLDRGRMLLAAFAVLMLVLCFTPAPIRLTDLIAR